MCTITLQFTKQCANKREEACLITMSIEVVNERAPGGPALEWHGRRSSGVDRS